MNRSGQLVTRVTSHAICHLMFRESTLSICVDITVSIANLFQHLLTSEFLLVFTTSSLRVSNTPQRKSCDELLNVVPASGMIFFVYPEMIIAKYNTHLMVLLITLLTCCLEAT